MSNYLRTQRQHLREIDDARREVKRFRRISAASSILVAGTVVAWIATIKFGLNSIGVWDAFGPMFLLVMGCIILTVGSVTAFLISTDELVQRRNKLRRAEREYEDFCTDVVA